MNMSNLQGFEREVADDNFRRAIAGLRRAGAALTRMGLLQMEPGADITEEIPAAIEAMERDPGIRRALEGRRVAGASPAPSAGSGRPNPFLDSI